MHRFRVCLLVLVLIGANAQAADAPPAEAFFQRPGVMAPKLSPEGSRLAFMTPDAQGRVRLAVVELGSEKVHPLGVADADVIDFDWVSEKRLVYRARDLRAAGLEGVRRHRTYGVFSVLYDGSEFRRLVHVERDRDDETGRVLGWNYDLLAVPRPQPGVEEDTVLVGRASFAEDELDAVAPVRLNARTGLHRELDVGRAPGHARGWWFDSAGNALALTTFSDNRTGFYGRPDKAGEWQPLGKGTTTGRPFDIEAVDDAGHLYVSVPDGPGHTAQLKLWDYAAKAPSAEPLLRVKGFDFEGAVLRGTGGSALGVRVHAAGEATAWFDPVMKRVQAEVDAALPDHVNRLDCRRCGKPDMVVAVFSYADRDPGSLYVLNAATQRLQHVQAALEGIDPARMGSVVMQRIRARDGRELPVWLTVPADAQAGHPLPAVVMVHGGPGVRGGYWQWDAMNQFLASRGYLVIAPDFRGSAGYGEDHLQAGFKQWGRAMQDDLADALQWAVQQGLAAKGRACIMGGSYGGYAALMGPVRQPELYRCVIASNAVADLELFVGGSWRVADDLSVGARRYALPETVGDPDKDGAMLRANSPVLLARQMRAPVLMTWGEQDLRVPIAHGERMREALTAAGNPPIWVTYAKEGHGQADVANQLDFARRVEDFLAKHLH